MPSLSGIQWQRLAVESAAIVVSILLAFAIDAWWEERQERAYEAEILVGLDKEFKEVKELINFKLSQYDDMKTGIAHLLIAHESGRRQSDDMSIDVAVQWLVAPTSIEFGGGVLDAVVSAGRLEIISNKVLRAKLAGWQAVMAEIRDDEIGNYDLIQTSVIPYLVREGIPTDRGGLEQYEEWPTETVSIADDLDLMKTLLADPSFKALLDVRYAYIIHTIGEYDAAYRAADAILADINDGDDSKLQ